jgi:hypothetical protein
MTTPWTPAEIAERSRTIALAWAAASGRQVALADAAKVAKLRLSLVVILRILEDSERGPWLALRQAEHLAARDLAR